MTTRWGVRPSTSATVWARPNEESARGWVKAFTCTKVSPPWTELYRDDGDGWVLVERVVAERLQRKAAALRRKAHEIEAGGGIVSVNDNDRDAVAENLRERADRLDGDPS